MAFLEYLPILSFLFILISVLISRYRHQKPIDAIPTNWPLVGMFPAALVNTHRLHDFATDMVKQNGGTFILKGPWFANMDLLVTTDPLDIRHILSKNFSNYPKGEKFQKIFEVLGDGIINADGKMWEINHKTLLSVLKHEGFQGTMETIFWNKVDNRLMPMLETLCERGTEIDLQDIFQKFAFDITCKLLIDHDPESLSLDFVPNPLSKAFRDAEEAIILRHVMPQWLWKLQQTLGVGKEKQMSDGMKIIEEFIYRYLAQTQKANESMNHEAENFMFFTIFMRELKGHSDAIPDLKKFLKDALVNMFAAGKDTVSSALSWFFYLLARNPSVEEKILQEIQTHLEVNADQTRNTKKLDELVYLHGAICEALRLYPAIPFNHKCPAQPDTLPSGHHVDQNTNIILSFYSMARMKSIWGEDCTEFKPERWISDGGRIKHEPSYKFAVFNAGPRTCLGKNLAFTQMKMVSTTIIPRYHIQLVEGHSGLPSDSMVLHMKHGLKVRLSKRIIK